MVVEWAAETDDWWDCGTVAWKGNEVVVNLAVSLAFSWGIKKVAL